MENILKKNPWNWFIWFHEFFLPGLFLIFWPTVFIHRKEKEEGPRFIHKYSNPAVKNQMSWQEAAYALYSWEDIVVFTEFFFVAAFYSISRFSPYMASEGFAWRKFQNDHDRNY